MISILASNNDSETFQLLNSILKKGITKFVCLQQEVTNSPNKS